VFDENSHGLFRGKIIAVIKERMLSFDILENEGQLFDMENQGILNGSNRPVLYNLSYAGTGRA
jgi:hypothetical protein